MTVGFDPSRLESGLIVPVPSAEKLVGDWRLQLDAAAGWGVPAHVTVLYPFVPPGEIDDGVMDRLVNLFQRIEPFDFELISVEWFGDDVVYLAPSQPGRFSMMTVMTTVRWPEYPPYGGLHPNPTPHLTIGDNGDVTAMRLAEASLEPQLPIPARAEEVWLMAGSADTGWAQHATFRLGASGP